MQTTAPSPAAGPQPVTSWQLRIAAVIVEAAVLFLLPNVSDCWACHLSPGLCFNFMELLCAVL